MLCRARGEVGGLGGSWSLASHVRTQSVICFQYYFSIYSCTRVEVGDGSKEGSSGVCDSPTLDYKQRSGPHSNWRSINHLPTDLQKL